MIATGDSASHEEAWLALPWLANGRISQAERDKLEPHVRTCATCREELAFQRLLCNTLTAPDRVTYAPGPSFRKLMDRIDGTTSQARKTPERTKVTPIAAAARRSRSNGFPLNISLWRPPGLAWAASFVLMVGLAGIVTSVYRQSQTLYTTRSDNPVVATPNVLHIAFNREITIGEAQEVLRSAGARIVEVPGDTGVIGIAPNADGDGKVTAEHMSHELHVLSARLRADPRVRWVEPIAGDDSPGDAQESIPRGP